MSIVLCNEITNWICLIARLIKKKTFLPLLFNIYHYSKIYILPTYSIHSKQYKTAKKKKSKTFLGAAHSSTPVGTRSKAVASDCDECRS